METAAPVSIKSDLNLMSSRSLIGVGRNVCPEESREAGPPRALVADDDAGIRVLIQRILTRSGLRVDAVRDGAEAIEHILRAEYDVIVLDLMMPRITGFAVAEYLHQNRPELVSRVIVTTAFGANGVDKIRSMVDCCIEKPFEVSGLVEQVKAVLARHRGEKAPEVATPEVEATKAAESDESSAGSVH